MTEELTTSTLLTAYANGYFPMAEHQDDDTLYWFSPDPRGILPLEDFHIPHGLAKTLKKHPFTLRVNTDFEGTMRGCAEIVAKRKETWINGRILDLYIELHRMGHAHSVEAWREDKLVGGL
ncbi:MAG: leucyl/phenylalanyl-tRNA--protein transferase, partial [Opitutaceae bacterium]|nr:leucyl/phenylalanyl-tRNA--protein transferase [Opitutaceae bacterium]